MIDIELRDAFVATQAGVRVYEREWTHRWRLLRWQTRDGPGPRCPDHQRRDQNVRTSVPSGASGRALG